MTRACVYRVFDAYGSLLYVGCTTNLSQRMSHHAARSDWYCKTDRITTEWFDERRDALREEARAIFTESPAHNVRGLCKEVQLPSDASYPERVAQAVRIAIGQAGSSLSEIARETYIPFATLQRELSNPRYLNVQQLDLIARHLGVAVEQFTSPGRRVA